MTAPIHKRQMFDTYILSSVASVLDTIAPGKLQRPKLEIYRQQMGVINSAFVSHVNWFCFLFSYRYPVLES